jgi:hypothetical protein
MVGLTYIKVATHSFMREEHWVNARTKNTTRSTNENASLHAALLTGLGAIAFMGTVAWTVPAAARCMIDEGNGRYTPCEGLYKSKRCMIDEGNGRYTPCEALARRSKTKKKG